MTMRKGRWLGISRKSSSPRASACQMSATVILRTAGTCTSSWGPEMTWNTMALPPQNVAVASPNGAAPDALVTSSRDRLSQHNPLRDLVSSRGGTGGEGIATTGGGNGAADQPAQRRHRRLGAARQGPPV